MFIYSVTIHIQKDAEPAWVNFMQQKHIADVISTGYFTGATMRKSGISAAENTSTYNMEYTCNSKADYELYVQLAAPAMQKDVADRFVGKFTAERTFYEVVFTL